MVLAVTHRMRVATNVHDTEPAQVRAHRACHFLRGLAWRGGGLSSTRRRRPDEPGRPDNAGRLYLDGPDHLVCHRPVGPCVAAHRGCAVAGYTMWHVHL